MLLLNGLEGEGGFPFTHWRGEWAHSHLLLMYRGPRALATPPYCTPLPGFLSSRISPSIAALKFSQPSLPRKVKSLSNDALQIGQSWSNASGKHLIYPNILSTQPVRHPAGALGLTQRCRHTQSKAECEETHLPDLAGGLLLIQHWVPSSFLTLLENEGNLM